MSAPDASRMRAVVFDLDDTLYAQRDFKLSGFRAVARWLEDQDLADAQGSFAVMRRCMQQLGPSHPHLLDAALAALGLGHLGCEEPVRAFRGHRPTIDPFPGVEGMLADLRTRFRLGLLTDGWATVQRGKVAALGLDAMFDCILYSDEWLLHKPDPRLYHHFERVFGLQADQLVYVGDNPAKDFLAANQRGWITVRVQVGEHARKAAPSARHDSHFSIAEVTALPQLLSNLPAPSVLRV